MVVLSHPVWLLLAAAAAPSLSVVMNDLVSRFLANLPQSELSNWPRIFYQLEQVCRRVASAKHRCSRSCSVSDRALCCLRRAGFLLLHRLLL